jgi:hypothetical protein
VAIVNQSVRTNSTRIGVRVQDDLVKRVGIAVEDRRHDAVTGGRDAVTEDRIDLLAGTPQ